MKINLILRETDKILGGYENVCPFGDVNDKEIKIGDITKLDTLYDDGELDEVRAVHVLEFFGIGDIQKILEHWLKKLRKGGIINLATLELIEVADHIVRRAMDWSQLIHLIYGNQQLPWEFKKSGFTAKLLINLLQNLRVKVLSCKIEGVNCYLTGEKL